MLNREQGIVKPSQRKTKRTGEKVAPALPCVNEYTGKTKEELPVGELATDRH